MYYREKRLCPDQRSELQVNISKHFSQEPT